jgi:hypothetical protein
MKNSVYLLTALMFCCFSSVTFSQQKKANISFKDVSHDFGTIKENGGNVIYEFKFKNIGDDTLKLINVHASCGCTTPHWTKEPVAPGKSGFVSATYDPLNRPGDFNKTITVTTNSENQNVVLTIIGKVLAREKTIAEIYTQKIDSLRLKTNHISFTNTKNTQVKTDSVDVINVAPFNLKVGFMNEPAYLKIKCIPETLKPNEKGHIVATLDGNKVKDWGFVSQRITMTFNDKTNNNNVITISAVIEEDFAHLSKKDSLTAPVISFDNTTYNFDTITAGDIKEHEYVFTNTGKRDLIIRKVKAGCGCTATLTSKDTIQPGKSANIKATFNSNGKHGNENKVITVISNDPKNSSITLYIKGFIKEKPATSTNNNTPAINTNTDKQKNNQPVNNQINNNQPNKVNNSGTQQNKKK